MKISKITFITYHNWKTKRHGGFHQFAEYTCRQGIETVFFSFSRPYYIVFKKEERLNRQVFQSLVKGCCYEVGKYSLWNVTWPTFALPGFLRHYFPNSINRWLMCHSFISFHKVVKKWLKGTDCFVFESCDAVFLLDLIKSYFPKSLIVYRPSDPLVDFSNEPYIIDAEKHMIDIADKILLVNNESLDVYKKVFPDVFDMSKFYVVSNGVSVSSYMKSYECPAILKDKLTALYIGAFDVDWNLMIRAAKELPYITFVIITPHILSEKVNKYINEISNLIHIQGILPAEVPKWITNANLILQPFSENVGHFSKKSLGLTAKNYKAMAAKKPIVTYMIPMHLSRYGLITTNKPEDFIRAVAENINRKNVEYTFDISEKDWDKQCVLFMNSLKNDE